MEYHTNKENYQSSSNDYSTNTNYVPNKNLDALCSKGCSICTGCRATRR